MTNRNSKTHALVDANAWRPKSGRRGHNGAAKRRQRARVASEKRHEFRAAFKETPVKKTTAKVAKPATEKKAAPKKKAA